MTKHIHRRYGFTLLEMSVVLVILSLMLGGILAALTQESRRSQKAQLISKMDTIEQAILSFSKKYGKYALPCPAPFVAISNAGFGTAAASACASLTYKNGSGASGAVPVRTLGLTDDYAFDPWGNLFSYSVSLTAATTNAFSTTPPTSTSLGVLNVRDTTGNAITANAVAVLISHGPDGFGSFTREGTRKNAYSSNANQQKNCHCTASGADDAYSVLYVAGYNTQSSADSEAGYDDVVRFYQREFFLLSSESYTEKP